MQSLFLPEVSPSVQSRDRVTGLEMEHPRDSGDAQTTERPPHLDNTPDTQDSTMNSNGHDRFCSQERMMVNTKLKMISRRATTGEHTMQYTGGILLNCALETCIVLLTNVTLKKFLNVNKNRRM